MKALIKTSLLVAAILTSGAAEAADTATVTVSATVIGTCKFTTNTGTLAFGSLDPSNAVNVAGTASQPVFWCTRGASYTISDDDGLHEASVGNHQMQSTTLGTPEYIPYTFNYTATGTGTGPASPVTMNISGQVAGTDYANASADIYGDTVTLSITP